MLMRNGPLSRTTIKRKPNGQNNWQVFRLDSNAIRCKSKWNLYSHSTFDTARIQLFPNNYEYSNKLFEIIFLYCKRINFTERNKIICNESKSWRILWKSSVWRWCCIHTYTYIIHSTHTHHQYWQFRNSKCTQHAKHINSHKFQTFEIWHISVDLQIIPCCLSCCFIWSL